MDHAKEKTQLLHQFANEDASISLPKLFAVIIIFILFGIGTGYLLAQNHTGVKSAATQKNAKGGVSKGEVYGSDDTKTFKDTTEGVMAAGGIKDEGQFHLTRQGGESQNVYLTSSLVDLSQFVGHKVKVWGQTQKAKYAGWLMDVGKIEVLE